MNGDYQAIQGSALNSTVSQLLKEGMMDEAKTTSGLSLGTIRDKQAYGNGCTRSGDTDAYSFDLIPSIAERREAKRWAQGEIGHGRGNWLQGQPIAVQLNHLIAHVNAYRAALERGDALDESKRDDHLAAIRCNAAMLMEYEEKHPEMFAVGEWQKPYRVKP